MTLSTMVRLRRTLISVCWRALLIVVATGSLDIALADPIDAMADAVSAAFTTAQIAELARSSAAHPAGGDPAPELERLQHLLGVSTDVVTALLRNLNRSDILPPQLSQTLAQSVGQYNAVVARLAEISLDEPEARQFATQASLAMPAGDFANAATQMEELENWETAAVDRSPAGAQEHGAANDQHLLTAARVRRILGELALMQLRYDEAAQDFQKAAALLPAGDVEDRLRFLTRRGDALSRRGTDIADTVALQGSVAAYQDVLNQWPPEKSPDDRARTQYKLGLALKALGEQGGGASVLHDAAAAFRSTLKAGAHDASPLVRADVQRNLADVLSTLGQSEQDSLSLQEAIIAYRGALDGISRDSTPIRWAVTQYNLANALFLLGGRRQDHDDLSEALEHLTLAKAAFTEASLTDLADSVSPVITLVEQRLALLKPAAPATAQQADAPAPQVRPPPPPVVRPTPPPASESTPVTPKQTTVVARAPPISPEPRSEPQAPRPEPADRTLPADVIAMLLSRGDAMLAIGDVSSARLLYERAASGGDGRAATGAGKTYDPTFLARIGARGIAADPAIATSWYRKAIELGDQSASELLRRMSERADR
jgi:tetratricopeptide (TPR) repeat protein